MFYHPADGSRQSKFFGLFFVLLTAGLGGFAAYAAFQTAMSYRWRAVPCVIAASGIKNQMGETPYTFQVVYRYAWQGKAFAGETYQKDFHGTADLGEVERLAAAFPVNAHRVCFVNPAKPTEAILVHDNILWPILSLGFCVLGSSLLARVYLFARRPGREPIGRVEVHTGVFLGLMGLTTFLGFFGRPLRQMVVAWHWRPTPAVVLASEIRQKQIHGEVHFTAYWPDVVFRYRVNGRDHRSNNLNFTDFPTPWYYGKRGIARRYPPGSRVTCYVNPSDPFEAVLTRDPSVTLWLGLWPLTMALLGIIGAAGRRWSGRIELLTSRFWKTLSLCIATGFSSQILIVTGEDLQRDWQAGLAEWPEFLVVGLMGVVTLCLFYHLARALSRTKSSGTATARRGPAQSPTSAK
jgi:hypothetical protein